jgi:hypothetical protein
MVKIALSAALLVILAVVAVHGAGDPPVGKHFRTLLQCSRCVFSGLVV